jgi:beta-mannosidase
MAKNISHVMVHHLCVKMVFEVSLSGLWKFRGFKGCDGEEQGAQLVDSKVEGWLLAEAPLTAHTNLMANKLIPDPFMGSNEREVQWVNESEWWYRKEIELTPEILNKDVLELSFESLDTFATVWVNDVKVGEANNMFTPWRFNIKGAAKMGSNLIAIRFKPVYHVAGELEAQHKHKYACLSADNFSARPYVRKAQYSFGWDWGPVLPTSGIWRQAKVVAYNTARLGYVAGLPVKVSKQEAEMKVSAEIFADKETKLMVKFTLAGFGQTLEQQTMIQTSKGRNFADCTLHVDQPHLWWPLGYGEPALYDAKVEVYGGTELLDSNKVKVGIRSIQLIQEPDEEGKSFIFQINNQNVFCKGANWIPADSFLPKVNYERYQKLLKMSAEANFNMLRVWGGGVYEADEFYHLCDELGIMVWQDFMYACAGYPEEEWFLREAEREAMEAVLRLRGHPSIVLWCGNNENQWLHSALWRVRDKVERLYGSQIYEQLLLRVCQFLDPTRPYRPSTPYGGEDASGRHEGDKHNWEVWSQGIDYPAYLDDDGRFISEFGWQAPPSLQLLKAYLEEQDLNPNSFTFRSHEKQTGGLELLKALLSAHYPVPADIRRFILFGQLNQADALKTAVTHWRSRMWKTSGCLIWQLNDCWPVVSWSLIDYGLTPKAAYYAVKRACQPVISPIIIKNGTAQVYVVNETANNLELDVSFGASKFSGEPLQEYYKHVSVPAFTSVPIFEKTLNELQVTQDSFLFVTAKQNEKVICCDTKIAFEPKDTKFPIPKITFNAKKVDAKTFEVTLRSQLFAKAVNLEAADLQSQWSDTFFDLPPKKEKAVICQLERDLSLEQFEKTLTTQAYPY